MIIANAQIAMAASHDYHEDHQITEKLDFWLAAKPTETVTQERVKTSAWDEQVSISQRGFSLSELRSRGQSLKLDTKMDSHSRVNLIILKQLYESITGQPMTMIDPSQTPTNPLSDTNTTTQTLQVDAAVATPPPAVRRATSSAGFGLIYQRREHYQEQEKMEFKAEGIVRTKDGRDIAFSTSLTMSRDYYQKSNLNIRAGDAAKIDPLVINFDGKGAELSQTRFKFDLDNDGTEEQIASLRSGSGFLALDRNGDGIINNGSELFGPASGQGFAELAKFDEDGNHFIDEGDSIYNKLRIWSFNEDGSSQLVALGDKQIGAIFLGHVTSPFQLKDEKKQSLGEVANSGIYLKENGQTGVVQEINLTV
jgi:hypothetical protein